MADKKFSNFTDGDEVAQGDEVVGLRSGDNFRFDFPGAGLRDGDLNYMFQYGSRGAASQNYLKLWNSAASDPLEIEAIGVASTIDITLTPKGAGSGVNVPTPTQGTHAANKDYADSIASGLSYFLGARLASLVNFNATYNNGTAGVGATLTATSNGAISFDSTAVSVGDAVVIWMQTNTFENGLYLVTQVGDASNPGILTRSSHFDTSAKMQRGDSFCVAEGALQNGTVFYLEDPVPVVGTDAVRLLPIRYVTLESDQTITGEKTFSAETFFADKITHAGDTNNFRSFGTDTQDFQTGGSSRLDISDSGVRLGGANSRVTTILDEDNMASDSATALATQQSIKAYVDSQVGGIQSVQVFTVNGTWNKPAGVNTIIVEAIGGGGGGAGIDANTAQISVGGGGGAGGYAKKLIDVSAISSESVTIGAAGAGGSAGANPGATGGTTSFGAHVSCTGGAGGASVGPSSNATIGAAGGAGGSGSSGDVNQAGAPGGAGIIGTGGGVSGLGASSFLGGGAVTSVVNSSVSVAGTSASSFGAGGAGAIGINTTTDRAGGDGASGIVIVWEYA